MGGSVSLVDDFQGELWRGWKSVRNDLVQVGRVSQTQRAADCRVNMACSLQPAQLGLFRSDYLLHGAGGGELEIKQVEFNTIASSFGSLSQRSGELHKCV